MGKTISTDEKIYMRSKKTVLEKHRWIYGKYKCQILYLLFGGISFFINIGLFASIDYVLHMNALMNNIICWIVCVLFQFFTNRTWVFEAPTDSTKGFFRQIASFIGGRIFTLGVEELIIWVFVIWLCFNSIIVKLSAQVAVIVLNYIISKFFVFTKKEESI